MKIRNEEMKERKPKMKTWIRLGRRFALHPSRGVLRQLSGIFEVGPPFDLLAVIFDGLDAQVQFRRDFLGLPPAPDQLKNFQFAITETFHW